MIFWKLISFFGSLNFWIVLTISTIIIFLISSKKIKKRMRWFILTVLSSAFLSWLLTEILKRIFKVARPCLGLPFCPTTYSFPSGHATVIFAAVTTLSFHYKDKHLRIFLLASGILVALSRLMLGVHRLEDIIAGSIIGILTGFLVQKVYKTYHKEIGDIVKKIE